MSFTGELEHLPIVDVIQLLHSTRKTGTLCIKGERGECQLVFNEGDISSANHANTSVRIGKILVDMRAVSQRDCDAALAGQKEAGAGRKPLIATLIEQGVLKKDDAYKGLRNLIEMTVVEMLRWTKGTFTLDVSTMVISDEYRYFPEMLHQEINLDTQGVLMDALRIFDEKNRDGAFVEESWDDEESGAADSAPDEGAATLSADDLGLADLDRLERKIPEVFASIEVADPVDAHGALIGELWPTAGAIDRARMVEFLVRLTASANTLSAATSRGLIFYSRDRLARHVVMTLCRTLDILTFTTDDAQDLDMILDQSLRKGIVPLLVFDAPNEAAAGWSALDLTRLRQQKKEKYSQVPRVQFAGELDEDFMLQAYQEGTLAVLPRPRDVAEGGDAASLLWFFEVLMGYLKEYFVARKNLSASELRVDLLAMQELRDAPELSQALLRRLAGCFARALTLIVRGGELVAEKGIGIDQDKRQGPAPVAKFTIAPRDPGPLRQVLTDGHLYYGPCADPVLDAQLYSRIGAPRIATTLLLPILSRGRVIAIVYGDFGEGPVTAAPIDFFAVLAGQAGLVLENAIYRRQLEKSGGPG